jgi:hypothetical protein
MAGNSTDLVYQLEISRVPANAVSRYWSRHHGAVIPQRSVIRSQVDVGVPRK